MGRIVRSSAPSTLIAREIAIGEAVAQGADAEGSPPTKKTEQKQGDQYLERVVKYIPAEVVAFFIFVNSILGDAIDKAMGIATPEKFPQLLSNALDTSKMAGMSVWTISWIMVFLCLVLSPMYLLTQRDPDDPQERLGLNATMAVLAFPVWAYAVDAVAFRPWHDGALASIVLAAFSIVSGAVSPQLIAWFKDRFKRSQ